MLRGLAPVAFLVTLVACRPYDGYGPLVDDSGLVPADRFARYGAEQAQAVAIGLESKAAQ